MPRTSPYNIRLSSAELAQLEKRAGRILDLYARQWEGEPLEDDEFAISADEMSSIQARRGKHSTGACRPRGTMQVEHEYFRCGAWTYIAGLDVHMPGSLAAARSKPALSLLTDW
jgi:hypothetical protein